MSIYKVNSEVGTSTKIDQLSDMVLELEGLVGKATFDKNELDQAFTDFGIDRKFLRNQSLGHTVATYTGWTHFYAETGYSIWYYTPSNYSYNINNQLYFDNKLLNFKGEASSTSASTFDYVFEYDSEAASGTSGYTTHTTEAGTELGTEFEILSTTEKYLYLGSSATFGGFKIEFKTRGANYTLVLEYWNGSEWTVLDDDNNNLDDNTSNFQGDGSITFDVPSDWQTTTINSSSAYWIRISTTTTPTTTAEIYYLIPNSSVIGLLALSTSEILNEDWAWCSYGSNVYVTIRNSADSHYEGNAFITSTSSSANKQNFFVSYHEFTGDYQDSTYVATTPTFTNGLTVASTAEANPVLTLTTDASYSALSNDPTLKMYQIVGQTTGSTATVIGNWTLDDNTTYIFRALVVARRTGGASGAAGDSAGYVATAVYKRVSAGVATLVGSVDQDVVIEDQSGWNATYVANADNVGLVVTGASSNNVTWHADVMIHKIAA